MLVRLTEPQIGMAWPKVKPYVAGFSTPDGDWNQRTAANVLRLLQEGTMQLWAMVWQRRPSEEAGVVGWIITLPVREQVSGDSNLFIWLFRWSPGTRNFDLWADAMRTLCTYAKSIGCKRLITKTRSEMIAKGWEELGGQRFYFLAREV